MMVRPPDPSGSPSNAEPQPADFNEFFSRNYEELREIARLHLQRESSGHTLQATALVHEAYLKLIQYEKSTWKESARFRAFVSKAMRHVLIDHARSRATEKRGGGVVHVTLVPGITAADAQSPVSLLELDDALTRLGGYDERLVRVVECRFFGGLSTRETAEALDISISTVERDWTRARSYLHRMLFAQPGRG